MKVRCYLLCNIAGILLGLILCGLPSSAAADDPVYPADTILGVWETERQDTGWSKVEIYEENGQLYLLYSVAGEQGTAIARLEKV